MINAPRFGLLTLLEATTLFAYQSHAELNKLILRLSAENDVPMTQDISRDHKSNDLFQFAKENPNHQTLSGLNLVDEIVEQATVIVTSRQGRGNLPDYYAPFLNALARDGFTLSDGTLRRTLPPEADLPNADDELHALLDEFGMATIKGHLDQAIDNHSRGQWAAANGQLRTFMQGLFDEIARHLAPVDAGARQPGEGLRQLLASIDPPFLRESIGEWSTDGKNFVNGTFKRLHPEGAHPGLSDEEDCTFRLHLVLIVAGHFMRRIRNYGYEADA